MKITHKEAVWNDIVDTTSLFSSTSPSTTHDICADMEFSLVYSQLHVLSHSHLPATCAADSNKSNILSSFNNILPTKLIHPL